MFFLFVSFLFLLEVRSLSNNFNLARGSNVALVTPFKDTGKIDFHDFNKLIDWQISEGTKGIVILGTTGEGNTLSKKERIKLIKTAKKTINNRVPLLVGTGCMITKDTVECTLEAMSLGVQGALIVTPYYCKPSQESLIKYYSEISDKILEKSISENINPIPIILYNVPSRTGVNLEIETIKELSQNNLIAGIKDASDDCNRLVTMKKNVDKNFLIFSGDDKSSFSWALKGADGVISVTANILPNYMSQLIDYGLHSDNSNKWKNFKDFYNQNKYNDVHDLLFIESNPIPVKWALYKLNITKSPYLRKPLHILNSKFHSLLNNRIKELK